MRIVEIRAHRVELPLHEGSYNWSGGNRVEVFDSTVVAVVTDAGLTGYGEICPLGPAYLPAFAAGARAGIAEIAPHLLGQDPTRLGVINRRMDQALRGHPYAKSALDMACWDLLGQTCGQSVATLLGGTYGDTFALYRAISQDSPEAMAARVGHYRAEGYTKFQLKVGGDPDTDIARIRAAAAMLRPGDVLIKIGDREIFQPSDVLDASFFARVGEPLKVTVLRNGKPHTVTMTLTPRPETSPVIQPVPSLVPGSEIPRPVPVSTQGR